MPAARRSSRKAPAKAPSRSRGRKARPAARPASRTGAGKGRPASSAARGGARKRAPTPASKAKFPVPEGWSLDRGGTSISREVKAKDFLEAVEIINAIAPLAEEMEHHPDFHLERWNRLRITTYSHDVGALTPRDRRLAEAINDLLGRRP